MEIKSYRDSNVYAIAGKDALKFRQSQLQGQVPALQDQVGIRAKCFVKSLIRA